MQQCHQGGCLRLPRLNQSQACSLWPVFGEKHLQMAESEMGKQVG